MSLRRYGIAALAVILTASLAAQKATSSELTTEIIAGKAQSDQSGAQNQEVVGQASNEPALSVEQITAEAQNARRASEAVSVVDKVFKTRQLDLFLVCFKTPQTRGMFTMKFYDEPASGFKNKLILRLLQEPWPYDGDPPGSRPAPLLESTCLEALKKYLPDEKLSQNQATFRRLNSFEERLKLGGLFEKALSEETLIKPKETVQTAPPQTDDKTKDSNSTSKIALPKTTPPGSAVLNENSNNNTKMWVMVVMGILLVLTIWGLPKKLTSSRRDENS